MLLGFNRRFAPMVEDGSKTHTIRGERKIHPKVGEMCHCYVDPRQKTMRLLGRWPCVKVERIRIYASASASYGFAVFVDGVGLDLDEKNGLAWRDGFRSSGRDKAFDEMTTYWITLHRNHGTIDFDGHIIHWKYTPTVAPGALRRRKKRPSKPKTLKP